MKCYKLVFSKNSFKNNYGNIIVFILLLIYLACFIFYIIKGNEQLKNQLVTVISKIEEMNEKINGITINYNRQENKINQNNIIKNKIISNPLKKFPYKNNIFIGNKNEIIKVQKITRNYLKIDYFYESLKPYLFNHMSDKKILKSLNDLQLSEKKKL